MPIDYLRESEKYRPEIIKTLLVGEAPPPPGKTYFYVPQDEDHALVEIRQDRSLPSTVFYHYFQERPTTREQYLTLLTRLKENGIFLIDICHENIQVRNCPQGLQRIKDEIPNLRLKMMTRDINIDDRDIVFLLPRKKYTKDIRCEFPDSKRYQWVEFRMNPELLLGTSEI